MAKFAQWENVIRTVLAVKVPPGFEALPEGSANGQATDNLNSLLGIYPTLLDRMEHHAPPIRSREHFFSDERAEWMKRFD